MNPLISQVTASLSANKREKTKGGLGGFCALSTCRTRPALFLQRTTGRYYCRFCATNIERFRNQFKKETDVVQALTATDYIALVRMEMAIVGSLK